MLGRLDRAEVAHELGRGFGNEGTLLAEFLGIDDPVIGFVRLGQARVFFLMLHPVKPAGIHDRSADRGTVAVHVFCRGMRYDIGSPFDGPAVHGRREGIIHDQRHAVGMGGAGKFFDIEDGQRGVCYGFSEYGAGIVLKSSI